MSNKSKFKLWSGLPFVMMQSGERKQIRTIVKAKTKKRAVELLGACPSISTINMREFNCWWCETKNYTELEVSKADEEAVYVMTRPATFTRPVPAEYVKVSKS
jgi:hypothetical protein